MKIGEIVNGKVFKIVSYGAFVQVDEYVGLVHISDFSDKYVRNIRQFVKIGDTERFKIIDIDEENKRLTLSYKLIHKVRGFKCEVPTFEIGFASLKEALPNFIKEKEKENESNH